MAIPKQPAPLGFAAYQPAAPPAIGFNYAGPLSRMTTEQLLQAASNAFRPPTPLQMTGMNMAPPGSQGPGFDLGDGPRELGRGLGTFLAKYFDDGVTAVPPPAAGYVVGVGADGRGVIGSVLSLGPTGSSFRG